LGKVTRAADPAVFDEDRLYLCVLALERHDKPWLISQLKDPACTSDGKLELASILSTEVRESRSSAIVP
jgi:hypothetical protein